MTKSDLKDRTKRFALAIIRLSNDIPNSNAGKVICNQILRSATSVSANYRAACRSKSDKDFLNKMIIVEEEADETSHWLEILQESGMMSEEQILPVLRESNEMVAIFTASGRTVRDRLNQTS